MLGNALFALLNLSFLRFFGICAILGGFAFAVFGIHLLPRFAGLIGDPLDRVWLTRGFGPGVVSVGIAILLEAKQEQRATFSFAFLLLALIGAFLALAMQFEAWWIDDAGITFSYSRSLAEGSGITFQPGEPSTEGYSSSLWMMILALSGWAGFDIPMAAKLLGILIGIGIIKHLC